VSVATTKFFECLIPNSTSDIAKQWGRLKGVSLGGIASRARSRSAQHYFCCCSAENVRRFVVQHALEKGESPVEGGERPLYSADIAHVAYWTTALPPCRLIHSTKSFTQTRCRSRSLQ
jgi:hypothetical protein